MVTRDYHSIMNTIILLCMCTCDNNYNKFNYVMCFRGPVTIVVTFCEMNVLGQVKVSWLIHFNALLGLGTFLLCYSLAQIYGHVSLWPVPMISDCAVRSPEKFPFRLGIVTTALLMGLISVLIFLSSVSRSKIAVVLGVLGSLPLAVVGVVNEEEASKVHSGRPISAAAAPPPFNNNDCFHVVSAILFFVFYCYMVVLTFYSSWILLPYGTSDPVSTWTIVMVVSRQTLTFLCGIALVLAIIVSILFIIPS